MDDLRKNVVINVQNVSKKFKVYLDKGHTLKEKLLSSNRRKYEEREVLKGVSFSVHEGEALGLIGENGCGKSTTLKLLTRIMYPDSGSIDIKGRVSSLIELGAGFHPDMSGRENIYTNAAIFGLTRKEIESKIDDIIAFSELEEYMDNPVRTYSSGMYTRLAFAVAINVNAQVLLIDEILAVGDTNFQEKCFNKLREIKASGTTIVIVSHSLGQIEQFCDRTIWIKDGKIVLDGLPRDVHPEYLDYMGKKRQQSIDAENQRKAEKNKRDIEDKHTIIHDVEEKEEYTEQGADEIKEDVLTEDVMGEKIERWGNGDARIVDIKTKDESGIEKSAFKTGETICLDIVVEVYKKIKDATFGIGIFRADGIQCYGTNTTIDKCKKFDLDKNGRLEVRLNECLLLPGEYSLDIAIQYGVGLPVDYFTKAYKFTVYSSIGDVGVSRIEHSWAFEGEKL